MGNTTAAPEVTASQQEHEEQGQQQYQNQNENQEDLEKSSAGKRSSPDKRYHRETPITGAPVPAATNSKCDCIQPLSPPPYAPMKMTQRGDIENEGNKICRICLEEDYPETMIAPCKCKGSSKWVHRDCLNEWRTNERDRAFATCTECLFEYHLIPPTVTYQNPGWRLKTKFTLLVSRDICMITVLVQLAIGFLGGFIYLFDVNETIPACIGAQAHPIGAYYLFGLFGLLMCLGIYGSCMLCSNNCSIRDSIPDFGPPDTTVYGDRSDAYRRIHNNNTSRSAQRHNGHHHSCVCCPYGCHNVTCYPIYYDGNGDCCCCCCGDQDRVSGQRGGGSPFGHSGGGCCCCPDGGDCGGGDDGCVMVLLLVLLIVAVIMAILGFLYGIVLSVVAAQRIIQRHAYLLHKRQLVNDYQVQDLAGYDLDQPIAIASTDLTGTNTTTTAMNYGGSDNTSNVTDFAAAINNDEENQQSLHSPSKDGQKKDTWTNNDKPTATEINMNVSCYPTAPTLPAEDVAYLRKLGLKE